MEIRVVIPHPDPDECEKIQKLYTSFANIDTGVTVSALDDAVPHKADPADPYLEPAILRKFQEAEREGMDAVIIHCMDDPGLDAGRRLLDIPVVGPAQSSYHLAAMWGYRFSVLYPLDNPYYVKKLVDRYGLSANLASVRILDITLEQFATNKDASLESLLQSSIKAIEEDQAHVIVPACMYAVGLANPLQRQLIEMGYQIPVIDPWLSVIRAAETAVDLNISQSKRTYPAPLGISEPYW